MADRIYASYFGGGGDVAGDTDQGNAIAIDSHGNAYIAGTMFSSDMPTTTGAFQTALKGASDAYVAKLPLLLPVVVSPASLDFGTQLVGAITSPQTVTLTNNNAAALAITSIAVVATAPPAAATDFAIASGGTCGTSLPAGMSCTVNVTFTPSVASAESAKLVFTDADPSSPQFVTLTGTGTNSAPVVLLTPTTGLNFGGQLVTTTSSPAKMITLKNNGNVTLNIMSIASSGDFAETNTCGATLAATMSCSINVTFTPTATGARNGAVTVTDDANGSPQSLPLTGTGTDFTVTAPATFSVPRGSSQMFNVTVTPVSGFNQSVALTCTGAPVNTTCTAHADLRHTRWHQRDHFAGNSCLDGPAAFCSRSASAAVEPPNRALRKRSCAAGDDFFRASSAHTNRPRRSDAGGIRCGGMRRWRREDSDSHTHADRNFGHGDPFDHRRSHDYEIASKEEPGISRELPGFFHFQGLIRLVSFVSRKFISSCTPDSDRRPFHARQHHRRAQLTLHS